MHVSENRIHLVLVAKTRKNYYEILMFLSIFFLSAKVTILLRERRKENSNQRLKDTSKGNA